MGIVLRLLTSRLGLGGIAALLLIASATLGLKLAETRSDLKDANRDLARAGSEIAALTLDLGTCRGLIDEQNASVAAAAAETARRLAAAEQGQASARAAAEGYRRTAAAVRGYEPKGADACARTADVARMVREDLR